MAAKKISLRPGAPDPELRRRPPGAPADAVECVSLARPWLEAKFGRKLSDAEVCAYLTFEGYQRMRARFGWSERQRSGGAA